MDKEAIQIFFEFLSNKELSLSNLDEKIYSWSPNSLLEFSEDCQELLPTTTKKASSIFDFTANSQLSGSPSPCAAMDCRMQNVDAMARFATLYADRILLRNPFEDYHRINQFDDDSYEKIVNDLRIIYQLKPLLEAGLVDFVESPSPKSHFCLECYEKIIFSQPKYFGERLSETKNKLRDKYIKEAIFYIENIDGTKFVIKENKSESIDDGSCAYIIEGLSEPLERRLRSSDRIKLSKKDIFSLNILDYYAVDILDDIAIQNWCSNIYKTSYLTNRRIDLELISDSPIQETYNKALIESFSHYLPLIYDTTLSKLIKLRKEEGEAFLVYRDALAQALKTASHSNYNDLNQIFNDIVQPEINKINNAVKKRNNYCVTHYLVTLL